MKIVVVSETFNEADGGATGVAFSQVKKMRELGHDVFVFCSSKKNIDWSDNEKIFSTPKKEVRNFWRSFSCLRNLRAEKDFIIFLKQVKPDVVHFHNLYYSLPFSLIKIAKSFCPKVFFTAHDVMTINPVKLDHFVNPSIDLSNVEKINYKISLLQAVRYSKKSFNPFRNILIRYYLGFANKIFAVSSELKKALNQNKINNIVVLHNGVDINNWIFDEVGNFKNSLGLNDEKIILLAGRLNKAKGLYVMEDLMKDLKEKNINAKLLILGAKNKKVSDNIIYLEKISRAEMKKYYAISDLVIVPSICFDSFPTINLEAMASKKAVMASIFGGSREVVKDNETGYIVNPLDREGLFKMTIELLNNKDKANSFALSGFNQVKDNFSLEEQTKKLLNFYLEEKKI